MKRGDKVKEVRLIPAEHGKFHVYFNGEVVLEHSHEPVHYWPDVLDVMKKIDERLGSPV